MENSQILDSQEPVDIPTPQFEIGMRVSWNSINGDCGMIRGMRYVWSQDLQDWQYQYYIALDPNSPSYEWTKFDWGWQEDLAALFFPDFQTVGKNEEKTNDDE